MRWEQDGAEERKTDAVQPATAAADASQWLLGCFHVPSRAAAAATAAAAAAGAHWVGLAVQTGGAPAHAAEALWRLHRAARQLQICICAGKVQPEDLQAARAGGACSAAVDG
jgi:hypothetical protein